MVVGIDWGGTRIKGAVIDGATVRAHASIDTPTNTDMAATLDAIDALVRELCDKPDSVGIAIPGEVRDDGRCWRLPNVPGFEDVNIGGELTRRLGCPVRVENDAIAAALAERDYGWGQRVDSFLMVTLGTGIGGGLVIDRTVRRGAGGFSGEIGHVPVDTAPNAWPCGCGQRGCMESYAGTQGLLRRYAESGGEATTIQAIAEASGDASDAVFRQLGGALGRGLAAINNVLDLDAIVFTGGVANSFERFEGYLRRTLRAYVFAPPLGDVTLGLSQLGERAGVIGAAHLAEAHYMHGAIR